MSETKKLQNLHQRAILGEKLTPKENTALQNWYEKLDLEESSVLDNKQKVQNIEKLRQNLVETTQQTTKISDEVKTLVSQNESLRKENQLLKQKIESSLLEKVA